MSSKTYVFEVLLTLQYSLFLFVKSFYFLLRRKVLVQLHEETSHRAELKIFSLKFLYRVNKCYSLLINYVYFAVVDNIIENSKVRLMYCEVPTYYSIGRFTKDAPNRVRYILNSFFVRFICCRHLSDIKRKLDSKSKILYISYIYSTTTI